MIVDLEMGDKKRKQKLEGEVKKEKKTEDTGNKVSSDSEEPVKKVDAGNKVSEGSKEPEKKEPVKEKKE
jgi:hypothetical protein